jgi:hypothetical protein
LISVTGCIYYDPQKTPGKKHGLANVPVILQDINTQMRLGVLTNNAGQYSFYNVPEGEYRIVEAYGEPAVRSPGNFRKKAAAGPVPEAALPPVTFAPDPPPDAAELECITPNVLFITAGARNLIAPDIFNAPAEAAAEKEPLPESLPSAAEPPSPPVCEEGFFDFEPLNNTVSREFNLSLPVAVSPYAVPEKPCVRCSGESVIACGHFTCDNPGGVFEFTVTQKIEAAIPVKFGAEICFCETCAECECPAVQQ